MSPDDPPQTRAWLDVTGELQTDARERLPISPGQYRVIRLDITRIARALRNAPIEQLHGETSTQEEVHFELPWPDGTYRRFQIQESPVMAPELGRQFPEIKTYRGVGPDGLKARITISPDTFRAFVMSSAGTVAIDPVVIAGQRLYVTYFQRAARDRDPSAPFCSTPQESHMPSGEASPIVAPLSHGGTLRTYRIAIAATGEYTAQHGGTIPSAMAAIAGTLSTVNAVYESDVAVRFVLVPTNSSVVYTDGAADPFTDGNKDALKCEAADVLDTVILRPNYDIGHVFGTAGGGSAELGTVCFDNPSPRCTQLGSAKGVGASAATPALPTTFDLGFAAHEIGHQLNARHTFNSNTFLCAGPRDALAAYEPASGTTVMSYGGGPLCEADDLAVRGESRAT